MLCYRGMTFCSAPCATLSCRRKFTDADEAKARAWWGEDNGDPPISFSDMRRGCPDYTPTEGGDT